MSDSVGKISLDLEIQSDISKQISSVSNSIANNLKKSLSGSMKRNLENINSSTKKTMNNITNNINSSMKKSMTNISKTMKSILSNIKMPKINIPKPTSVSIPNSVEIRSKLNEIEKKEDVKIIYAVESGSRAWGFESIDSDYDVRFIYVRDKNEYLCLEEKSDVIQLPIDDVFDISGWDIKKALKLLYKSNPSLLEWFASPIVYKETKEASYIREVIPLYFSQKKLYCHYQRMAKTSLKYMNNEKVSVKKYLYILRCILSSQYIVHNKKQPPIEIERLIECELPSELREDMNKLLMIKKNSNEKKYVDHISSLDEFIFTNLEERDVSSFIDGETSWEPLNEVFRKVIEKNSDDMF